METYLIGAIIAIIISLFDLKRYDNTDTFASKLSVIIMYGVFSWLSVILVLFVWIKGKD